MNLVDLRIPKKLPQIFCLLLILFLLINVISAQEINNSTKRVLVKFKDVEKGFLIRRTIKADPIKIVAKYSGEIKKEIKKDFVSVVINSSKLDRLKHDASVDFVGDDVQVSLFAQENSSTQKIPWNLKNIYCSDLFQYNLTGNGVRIAILDTGIDYSHEDLFENYYGGYDFVHEHEFPLDDHGHGTHMAGIIAASNNNIGTLGIASDAEIYSLKVLNQDGVGYLSDVLLAFQWALDHHIDLVSMSFGTPEKSEILEDAVNDLYSKGILLVAAAGNEGAKEFSTVNYPAAFDAVIAVSATDEENTLATFSSAGAEIEFAAPGTSIYSTKLNSTYGYMSGTSPATPQVSAVAALYIQAYSNKTNQEIRDLMDSDAIDLGEKDRDNLYGYGLINGKNLNPKLEVPDDNKSVNGSIHERLQNLENVVFQLTDTITQIETETKDLKLKISNLENRVSLLESFMIVVNTSIYLLQDSLCQLHSFEFCPKKELICTVGEKVCVNNTSYSICESAPVEKWINYTCPQDKLCEMGNCVSKTIENKPPACKLDGEICSPLDDTCCGVCTENKEELLFENLTTACEVSCPPTGYEYCTVKWYLTSELPFVMKIYSGRAWSSKAMSKKLCQLYGHKKTGDFICSSLSE